MDSADDGFMRMWQEMPDVIGDVDDSVDLCNAAGDAVVSDRGPSLADNKLTSDSVRLAGSRGNYAPMVVL